MKLPLSAGCLTAWPDWQPTAMKASRATISGLYVISRGLNCNHRTMKTLSKHMKNKVSFIVRLCSKYRTMAFFILSVW